MHELEVIPEHGLISEVVEYVLGMHFSQAVASIQSMVGSVKGVQILYSDKDPLNVDLVINLTNDGIKLIFDPINQRLKTIEVHDLTLLKLKYSDAVFNSSEVSPTIEQIDQSFGATHPGVYDSDKQVFTLTFRGLSFEFPAETQFQPSYGGIRQELGRLQFPPGESPRVSKMYIYSGSSQADCAAPALPAPRYPVVYHEGVQVLRSHRETWGLRIRLSTFPDLRDMCSSAYQTRDVFFGDSVQDVEAAIGAPSRTFYKSEDKMKIHSPNAYRKSASHKSDYFYNYFTLGIDILLDARTNRVKKFVLHTNFPGHYNFNMYHRCQFELPLNYDGHHSTGSSLQDLQGPGGNGSGGSGTSGTGGSTISGGTMTPVSISSFSRWDQISEKLKPSDKPVVLNRASSTNTTNPFGSTFCYGYQDIIFEVMPNFHIASVTLYCQNAGRLQHQVNGNSRRRLMSMNHDSIDIEDALEHDHLNSN